MSGDTSHRTRPSLVLVAALFALIALGAGPVAHPAPANASAATMEAKLVTWINNARATRGIPPLKVGWRLVDLAGDRAATMARTGKMVHVDCLACVLRSRGVSFGRCAETLSYTTYPWGYEAAHSIFLGWKNSRDHWSILMSRSYTRFGVGVAYRSSDHATFAAAVLVG